MFKLELNSTHAHFAPNIWVTFQIALSLLLGSIAGTILLLDIPAKWEATLILAIGFAIILMVCNPKRVLLLTVAGIVPFYIGNDFFYRPQYLGEMHSVGFYAIDALVIGLLILLLARVATRQSKIRLFPRTTIPAIAWLTISALSVVNAKDVEIAAIQLIAMGRLFLIYLVVANSLEDEADVKWLTSGFLLGILCQGLIGSYQGITGNPIGLSFVGEPTVLFHYRAQGTIGHPNGYAMYLSATISFALILQFTRVRQLYKILAGIVLCVGGMGLIFSLSRGGWISVGVAFLLVLALAVHRKRLQVQTSVIISGATFLILLALILVQGNLIMSRLMTDDQGSAISRIAMASRAFSIIQDHPLSGVGLNNYSQSMVQYDEGSSGNGNRFIVHNSFLLIFAETGILGLVAFGWFLMSLLIQTSRVLTRAPNDLMWLAGLGTLSAFIALIVHNTVDYGLVASTQIFTLFWLLAAVVASLSQERDFEIYKSNAPVQPRHR